VLYYTLRKRWTVVISAVIGFVVVTLLSILILGADTYRSYIEEVMPTVSGFRHVWVNASLSGFWAKWFDTGAINPMAPPGPSHIPPLVSRPGLAAMGLFVSAIAVLFAWGRAVFRLPASLTFGLTLTTMLLLSPVTWDHYFLLLLLPVIQLWRAFPEPRWERIALIMTLVPISLSPLVFVEAFGGTETFVSLIGVSIQFFALTALFLLGLVPPPKEAERPSL
jgi:hypothetical protein